MMWYILIGILGGVLGGMGMGGGTLTIPLLSIFMGVEQKYAQGINLLAFVPMAAIALVIHSKHGLVQYKKTYVLALVGVVSSVGSAMLVTMISNEWLKRIFGAFLIMLAIYQLVCLIKRSKKSG